MIAFQEPVADREDTTKRFNLLEITFNDDISVKSYVVNQKKLDTMILTSGFFAHRTIGANLDLLPAMNNYACMTSRRSASRSRKILSATTDSEPGQGQERDDAYSSTLLGHIPVYVSSPNRPPESEAVPPSRKSRVRSYRHTKLKNSDNIVPFVFIVS